MHDPDILRAITRRHFFKQSGFGIGGVALSALLDERLFAQAERTGGRSARAARAAFRAEGEAHHLPVHGRRADPARSVRQQAGAAEVRRPGDPRGVHSQRGAVRVHQGHAAAPRISVHVQEVRSVRRRAVGAAAAPGGHRRRHRDRPLDAHHAVQPRARPDLHEHGQPGVRPPERGILAHVRARQREPRSAGLRRAALGRERARRRQVVLGQRLPADRPSGGRVPIQGRPGAVRVEPGRRRHRDAARLDRSGDAI